MAEEKDERAVRAAIARERSAATTWLDRLANAFRQEMIRSAEAGQWEEARHARGLWLGAKDCERTIREGEHELP
jgi:hypothetical protein